MESPKGPASHHELRKTCDHCRKRKIKCSNENPCARCYRFGLPCRYSPTRPIGRPSKRQGTPPSHLNVSSDQDSSATDHAPLDSFHIPEDFTLDTFGAPMTFPTPPDEFPWPGWSVLETMMSAANPPNGMSQNQLVWTPAEESHIACDVDSSSQSHGSTDLNTQCQCGELARKHMNYRIDTQDLWGFLTRQRDSVGLAQKVLDCEDCGSLDNLPSQVAGNVMLFGAIMMDATSSCQSFIRALKQRALASADERCDVQIYLASKEAKDNHIEYQLERQHIWPLAKVLLRVETEKFHRICIAFITRQWRVHEKGHEICLPGGTCKKPKTTQTTSPADFCPRSTEPTLFFNCFRTAKHLQSVITDLQKDLE